MRSAPDRTKCQSDYYRMPRIPKVLTLSVIGRRGNSGTIAHISVESIPPSSCS